MCFLVDPFNNPVDGHVGASVFGGKLGKGKALLSVQS